jgi:hypothetical protein
MQVIALRKILRNYHVNFIGQLPSKLPYFGHSFEPEAVTIAKLPSNAGVLGSTHCTDENHRVSLHTKQKGHQLKIRCQVIRYHVYSKLT